MDSLFNILVTCPPWVPGWFSAHFFCLNCHLQHMLPEIGAPSSHGHSLPWNKNPTPFPVLPHSLFLSWFLHDGLTCLFPISLQYYALNGVVMVSHKLHVCGVWERWDVFKTDLQVSRWSKSQGWIRNFQVIIFFSLGEDDIVSNCYVILLPNFLFLFSLHSDSKSEQSVRLWPVWGGWSGVHQWQPLCRPHLPGSHQAYGEHSGLSPLAYQKVKQICCKRYLLLEAVWE